MSPALAAWERLRPDERGLVPAVAQDRFTGEVRMVAWMSRDALEKTLATGLATFFSRSRERLWTKGEESGHVLRVHEIVADCDGDTLLLLVDPEGPSCHTGTATCFFRRDGGRHAGAPALPGLATLERAIDERRASTAERSYTRSLLDGGAAKIGAKLREEADELARAVAGETDERVASEAADVVYHLLVALASRGVPFREVVRELDRRAGTSGHAEKASRGR